MTYSIQDFAVKESQLTIAIGADHGGFAAKEAIVAKLAANNINVVDCGAFALDCNDDYPVFAAGGGQGFPR